MRRLFVCVLALFLLLSAVACFSQQTDIRQFSTFQAFSYLTTPSLNLVQRGYDGDFGVNVRPWLTLGFDFSTQNGNSTLLPSKLNQPTQAQLAPFLPIFEQLGIPVAVPYHATTRTYEGGPQFNYRHFKKFTLFARPALGAFQASFTAKPNNPAIAELVSVLLAGKTTSSETVLFWGGGGGVTWEATPHWGVRVAADVVRYGFFQNLLSGDRYSVRVVMGLKYSFGKNIVQK
jgi:hypothetical protein